MPEKKVAHFNITAIKAAFRSVSTLAATGSAIQGAAAFGHEAKDIVATIQTITKAHFYKSMTSTYNNKVWQDVYHVPHEDGELYIKFTDNGGPSFLLLSYKEK